MRADTQIGHWGSSLSLIFLSTNHFINVSDDSRSGRQSRGLNLSSPLCTPCHFSSAVMSALPSAKWPPSRFEKNHTPCNVGFLSNCFRASECRIFTLSRLYQPSLISVKVAMTGPGHTKLSALLSDGADSCLKPNILHVACKYYFMSLIYESSDRFNESICIIDSIDVSCLELRGNKTFWKHQTSPCFHRTKNTFF